MSRSFCGSLITFFSSSSQGGARALGGAPCWRTSGHVGLQRLRLLPQKHQGELAQGRTRGQPGCDLHWRAGRRRLVLPAALSPGVHAQVSPRPWGHAQVSPRRPPAAQRPQVCFLTEGLMCWSRSGEKISCVVEHASLKRPLITDWGKDPSACSAAACLPVPTLTCLSPPVCPQSRPCLKLRGTRSPSGPQDWSWGWSCLWLDSSTTRESLEVRPVPPSPDQLERAEGGAGLQLRPFRASSSRRCSRELLTFDPGSVSLNQGGFWFPVTDPGPGPGSSCAATRRSSWWSGSGPELV